MSITQEQRAERSAASPVARLSLRARRVVLTVHILGAGSWIGIDVVLGVMVFSAMLTTSADTEALCYRVLEVFAVWPLIAAGIVTLLSGVVLGLGTKYGLIRYWWVAVKLVLNVLLVALVVFALRPGLAEAAAYGEQLVAGGAPRADVGNLAFPPVVCGIALVTATVLSVFKPWGRIRRT